MIHVQMTRAMIPPEMYPHKVSTGIKERGFMAEDTPIWDTMVKKYGEPKTMQENIEMVFYAEQAAIPKPKDPRREGKSKASGKATVARPDLAPDGSSLAAYT